MGGCLCWAPRSLGSGPCVPLCLVLDKSQGSFAWTSWVNIHMWLSFTFRGLNEFSLSWGGRNSFSRVHWNSRVHWGLGSSNRDHSSDIVFLCTHLAQFHFSVCSISFLYQHDSFSTHQKSIPKPLEGHDPQFENHWSRMLSKVLWNWYILSALPVKSLVVVFFKLNVTLFYQYWNEIVWIFMKMYHPSLIYGWKTILQRISVVKTSNGVFKW